MTSSDIRLLETQAIRPNPENPRLVFYESELKALQESIAQQGILVPLTVFRDGPRFVILDGERRWKCALRLGLKRVPVIVQPKPDRLRNIMMMFAIHQSRKEWDPLPTAIKLQQLEDLLAKRTGKKPAERVLAENASISVAEVRRLKRILKLPLDLREELAEEQRKEPSLQRLTVDHVVEATNAAQTLRKRSILSDEEEIELRRGLVEAFRAGRITNTVDPRKLTKIAQAVARGSVPVSVARQAVLKLNSDYNYTIEDAYKDSTALADARRGLEQIARRLIAQLDDDMADAIKSDADLRRLLTDLRRRLEQLGIR